MTFAPRDGLDWMREEVVFALGFYFQIPWGKINQRNPVVIQAAQLLGRTPGSLVARWIDDEWRVVKIVIKMLSYWRDAFWRD